tara:strand:+ start:2300 stop:2581 length:282 start_codon:yes stop_codon:yes gene_type:complete
MVNWHELDFFTSRWLANNLPPNSFDNFVYQDDKYSLNNFYNENEENYEYEFDDLFEFNNSNDNYINYYNNDHLSDYYQSSESEEDDYEYYNYN